MTKKRKPCLMCGKLHTTREQLDACFERYTSRPPSKLSPWVNQRDLYKIADKFGQ